MSAATRLQSTVGGQLPLKTLQKQGFRSGTFISGTPRAIADAAWRAERVPSPIDFILKVQKRAAAFR